LINKGHYRIGTHRHASECIGAHRPRVWPHRPGKTGAGVWNYSFTVWILGER